MLSSERISRSFSCTRMASSIGSCSFRPPLHVVGREPAAHAVRLQVGPETVGKLLVLGRVADETRVEFDRVYGQRAHVLDERIRHAHAAKEYFRNVTSGSVNRVDSNMRGPRVFD